MVCSFHLNRAVKNIALLQCVDLLYVESWTFYELA